MVWQDVFPISVSRVDAEEERELRLAAQARAGAEWAFAALVARYQPPVTRYLSRLTGNPALARTLAERIFVRMERRVRGPQGGLHLRLWVLRACTEAGLEAVRQPRHSRSAARLESPHPAGLLTGRGAVSAPATLRAGLDALANLKGTTSRQVRKLIWSTPGLADFGRSAEQDDAVQDHAQMPGADAAETVEEMERLDPREALRYRMVRAVLAELPYGDAQCLALHLVAGLNQAEVAQALGITHSATRKRIVHGLQLFAQRYEAAAISLGLPADALAPSAASSTETAAPLPGAGAEEDELEIANEPTLDLKRPTIVTGTIAAISPVIRSDDGDGDISGGISGDASSDTAGAAARPVSDEAEASSGSEGEAAGAVAEPAHVYPAIAEVAVVAAPESVAHQQQRPFVVALAAEAVEVVVSPPAAPEEIALIEPAALPAPPAPPRSDVRFVPVLTTIDDARGEPAPAEQAAAAISVVRIVPVLTMAPGNVPGSTAAEQAVEAESTAPEGAARIPQASPVSMARLVPVVTPRTDAVGAGQATWSEDLIATTPLHRNHGSRRVTGNSHERNPNGDSQDAANGRIAATHEESLEESLAVVAVTPDDASTDI